VEVIFSEKFSKGSLSAPRREKASLILMQKNPAGVEAEIPFKQHGRVPPERCAQITGVK